MYNVYFVIIIIHYNFLKLDDSLEGKMAVEPSVGNGTAH
jgi:hypothetical protein